MKNVNVFWLVNHIIHNYHDLIFIDKDENEICVWNDDYYKEHKEELHKMNINFISINAKYVKVYLK